MDQGNVPDLNAEEAEELLRLAGEPVEEDTQVTEGLPTPRATPEPLDGAAT